MERTDTASEVADEPADFAAHLDAVLAYADDVAWVVIDDEVVVYHTPSSTSYVLNPSAGLVWRCFDAQSSLDEILTDIADMYQVDQAQLVGEVTPVVGEWLEAGLVTMAAQP